MPPSRAAHRARQRTEHPEARSEKEAAPPDLLPSRAAHRARQRTEAAARDAEELTPSLPPHEEMSDLLATLSEQLADKEEEEGKLDQQRSELPTQVTPAEEDDLKKKAFRAVAQDDTNVLAEVLQTVRPEVWSGWQNGARKSLLV